MPRYDYQCTSGHKYELQQPFGSPTEHDCQKCGKPARRIVTVAPPLVFKASGYYKSSGRDFSSDGGSDSSSAYEKRTSRKGSRSESASSAD